MEGWFLSDVFSLALAKDGVSSSRALVDDNVNTNLEILMTFDEISYDKGATFLRMVNGVLGDELFFQGVTDYLNMHRFGSGSYVTLFESWQALVDESPEKVNTPLPEGKNIFDIFESWLIQPGYPVVSVFECEDDMDSWCVTQKRFLFVPEESTSSWFVPFDVKNLSCDETLTNCEIKESTGEISWMSDTENVLNIGKKSDENGLIVFPLINYGTTGFFRSFTTDENYLKALSKLADENSQPLFECKYRFLSRTTEDQFSMSLSGEGTVDGFMSLIETSLSAFDSFENTGVSVHWYTALNSLKTVADLERHAAFNYKTELSKTIADSIDMFSKQFLQPLFDDNSFIGEKYDMEIRQQIGEKAIVQEKISYEACFYGVEDCLATSASFINPATDLELLKIDPNIKKTVYCNSIKSGGYSTWNLFKNYYTSNTCQQNSQEASVVRKALACSDNTTTLSEYMELAFDESFIREADSWYIFSYVADNAGPGSSLVWNYMRNNFIKCQTRFGQRINYPFDAAVQFMSTNEDILELEDFFKKLPVSLQVVVKSYVDSAIETIQSNLMWRANYEHDLLDYLEKN